jgi:hypothetical protein
MARTRPLSALLALIALAVAVDAIGVGAPGLAVVAVPFVIALLLLRRAPRTSAVLAAVGSFVVAATATGYAVNDPGLQTPVDAAYVYVAGPLALVALNMAVRVLRTARPLHG